MQYNGDITFLHRSGTSLMMNPHNLSLSLTFVMDSHALMSTLWLPCSFISPETHAGQCPRLLVVTVIGIAIALLTDYLKIKQVLMNVNLIM